MQRLNALIHLCEILVLKVYKGLFCLRLQGIHRDNCRFNSIITKKKVYAYNQAMRNLEGRLILFFFFCNLCSID